MVEKSITGIVTWLKQWFYDRGDIDEKVQQLNTSIGTKVSSNLGSANMNVVTGSNNMVTLEAKNNHAHGALTSDGKVGTVSGKVVTTGTDGVIQASSSISASLINDGTAHSHIGSSANASQSSINSAIDSALASLEGDISTLSSMDVINVVSALPSQPPTEDNLNKLYIVVGNDDADIYYAEYRHINGNQFAYVWNKMDTDILDDLTLPTDVSDLTDNNDTPFTPKPHTHGQITNDGKITSTAVQVANNDYIVITDASDSSIVKRVPNLLANYHIKDSSAHSNIGTSANATQGGINSAIDTALGTKGALTDDIDWSYNSDGFVNGIKLHDKTSTGDDATGTITFHLKS